MISKISVIVPVYKVEAYLEQCIFSIVNQTYWNLEIILVDDGSLDDCPKMCDFWVNNDPRIKVIHKQNGGLSDARNYGIAVATGEYIGFVDSDDWIEEDFYETLIETMTKHRAQIGASDVVWVYEDHEERKNRYDQTVFLPREALETIIRGEGFYATAWNKLYESELIRRFPYPQGRLHEDEFVTYRVIAEARSLVLCQNTVYYYRQRKGSIMASVDEKHLDAIDAFCERLSFFKARFSDLYQKDKPYYCAMLVGYYRACLNQGNPDAQRIRKRLRQYRKNVHYSIREIIRYTLKQKLYVVGTAIDIDLFCRVINMRGKI